MVQTWRAVDFVKSMQYFVTRLKDLADLCSFKSARHFVLAKRETIFYIRDFQTQNVCITITGELIEKREAQASWSRNKPGPLYFHQIPRWRVYTQSLRTTSLGWAIRITWGMFFKTQCPGHTQYQWNQDHWGWDPSGHSFLIPMWLQCTAKYQCLSNLSAHGNHLRTCWTAVLAQKGWMG